MVSDRMKMALTVFLSTFTFLLEHVTCSASYINVFVTHTALMLTSQIHMTTQESSPAVSTNETDDNNSSDSYYAYDNEYGEDYMYDEYTYDEYMYSGYSFERPVYLFIWEILVIVTFLVNIVVISVLLRRKMRNATHMILVAIAIADSLTGLVTLPTYIMVYQSYDQSSHDYYPDFPANESANLSQSAYNHNNSCKFSHDLQSDDNVNCSSITNGSNVIDVYKYFLDDITDGYTLSKNLCRAFMISKYFLSKSFHAVSIFLTLFLGIQRYVSVAFPFKSQSIFSVRKTIFCCVIIFLLSPTLHSYHLFKEKAVGGLCQWELDEDGCGHDCIYLWILFCIRHFIPCFALTIFTILFIKHLRSGATALRKMDNNASQVSKRQEENRRISIIVTAIVVVFLVPEIPYGIFLFYSAIDKAVFNGKDINLERNRAIHMIYELSLLLSFHANFYIYIFLNRKFRKCLYRTFVKPVQRLVGSTRRLSITSQVSSTSRKTTRRTECDSTKGALEMKAMQSSSLDKSETTGNKLRHSTSPDISNGYSKTNSNNHETDALNASV